MNLSELRNSLKKLKRNQFLGDMNKAQKEAMKHPNKLGAGAKKRKKLSGKEKIPVVMSEFKRGTLHSGSGQIVKNPKQGIAIAISEARKKGMKVPKKKK